MDNDSGLTFTGRIRSIRCALKGVRVMIATQHNAWIHAAATVAAGFRAAGVAAGVARRVCAATAHASVRVKMAA